MKKLNLPPDVKRKQVAKAYKEAVDNVHRFFDGTIVKGFDNTPDEILFIKQYNFQNNNAIPFIYLTFNNENKLFFDNPGMTHTQMLDTLNTYLQSSGYKPSDVTDNEEDNKTENGNYLYPFSRTNDIMVPGRYYLIDIPELYNKKCVVFTFWKPNSIPKDEINNIVYQICKDKNLFDREIYIANGVFPMIHYNEFTPGDEMPDLQDNSEQYAMHLMKAQDKHNATEDFRTTRDRKMSKKLGKMTLAQYNDMKYGQPVAENKDVLLRRFINEAGITELSKLPNEYFECVNKYYNKGELTMENNKFILPTCHILNEVFKYTSNVGANIDHLTLRELFKKYGKVVVESRSYLNESIKKNVDAASRSHYWITGEKLDKYCHVVDDVIEEVHNTINNNKVLTKESLDELCTSDAELQDVMSSFDVQKHLNEKIWDEGNHLNPRVRMRLLTIADKFYETLEVNWVKPIDIIFTGSLCNYNWSKYSDIDLHIIVDFDEVDERTDFVKDYFDTKKKVWNTEHEELMIYGFPVELYVQDKNEEHAASGVYSLYKDTWIVEPSMNNFNGEIIDKKMIANKAIKFADKIDELEELANRETDDYKIEQIGLKVKKLYTKIKSIRKSSLHNEGELSSGNILFKTLRRLGYIGKLIELKAKTFDKINSIP